MMTNQKKLLIAAGVAVVLIGGGWTFAKYKATSVAKDQIDGYIIRHNLGGQVSYEGLSASPFGSVTLSGVRMTVSPANNVTIGSLDISNVEMKYDQIRSISISARDIQIPLLAIVKEDLVREELIRNLIGEGYVTLTGSASSSMRYDDQRGTLALETAGDIQDVGSWKEKVSFANVDPSAMNALYGLANAPKVTNDLATLGTLGLALQGLASLSLAEAELSVDNSGIHKRTLDIPGDALPPDATATVDVISAKDEMALVRAGMTPSEAHDTSKAAETWLQKGGTLKLATHLSQPLPLFRNGNISSPAFDNPLGFLAAAKVRISN